MSSGLRALKCWRRCLCHLAWNSYAASSVTKLMNAKLTLPLRPMQIGRYRKSYSPLLGHSLSSMSCVYRTGMFRTISVFASFNFMFSGLGTSPTDGRLAAASHSPPHMAGIVIALTSCTTAGKDLPPDLVGILIALTSCGSPGGNGLPPDLAGILIALTSCDSPVGISIAFTSSISISRTVPHCRESGTAAAAILLGCQTPGGAPGFARPASASATWQGAAEIAITARAAAMDAKRSDSDWSDTG
mmetsp:Transcript_112529/g.211049  ORF Transcript_112529/g.211049 Transcript_112529/m.211049 type:complete len:245 (+) Transcript_112529:377-1111(+)